MWSVWEDFSWEGGDAHRWKLHSLPFTWLCYAEGWRGRAQLAIPDRPCPHISHFCSPVPLQWVLSSGCADYTLQIVLSQSLRSHCLLLSPWVKQTLPQAFWAGASIQFGSAPKWPIYALSDTAALQLPSHTHCAPVKIQLMLLDGPIFPRVSFNCRDLRQSREP